MEEPVEHTGGFNSKVGLETVRTLAARLTAWKSVPDCLNSRRSPKLRAMLTAIPARGSGRSAFGVGVVIDLVARPFGLHLPAAVNPHE